MAEEIRVFTDEELQAMRETAPEDMVLIPPGEFMMGEGFTEPPHTVYLDPYYIDIHAITNEEYGKFLNETGYQSKSSKSKVKNIVKGTEKHPTVRVTWHDAAAFAEWAGKGLPSEAEWEKAARGGQHGAVYSWGNEPPDEKKANFSQNEGHTTPVGSYPPNSYGLFDMCGNVWEWCADWFDINYYKDSPYINPPGPDTGKERVNRGGSWFLTQNNIRCSCRGSQYPEYKDVTIGFRCVQSIDMGIISGR